MEVASIRTGDKPSDEFENDFSYFPELKELGSQLLDWMLGQKNRPVNVMIMGEEKSGKSTFVNSIFGKQIVDSDILPKTSVVTLFKYGGHKEMVIYFLDGSMATYQHSQFADLSGTDFAEKIDWVEMYLPIEFLKNITIIDSPGLNSQYSFHVDNTERFFRYSDVILWVSDCRTVQTQVADKYIMKIKSNQIPICVVLNQIDSIDEEEEDETVDEWIEEQRCSLTNQYHLFDVIGISAALVLKGKLNNDDLLVNLGRERSVSDLFTKILTESSSLKQGGKWRYFVFLQNTLLKRMKVLSNNMRVEETMLELENLDKSMVLLKENTVQLQNFIEGCKENAEKFASFLVKHRRFLSLVEDNDQLRVWCEFLNRPHIPLINGNIEELKGQLNGPAINYPKQKEKLIQHYEKLQKQFHKLKRSGFMETLPLFKNGELLDLGNKMKLFNNEVHQFLQDLEKDNQQHIEIIDRLAKIIQFINYHNEQTIRKHAERIQVSYRLKTEESLKKIDHLFFEMVGALSKISRKIISINQYLLNKQLINTLEVDKIRTLNKMLKDYDLHERLEVQKSNYESLMYPPSIPIQFENILISANELKMIEKMEQSNLSQIPIFDLAIIETFQANVIKLRIFLIVSVLLLLILIFK